MLLLIRRAAHPHVAFLGRIPGTRSFSDMERNPDNEAVPGVLVFRVEASLLYFNVEHVRDAVWQKIRSTAGPLKLVVCDLSTSPVVDLAGARMLATLHEALQAAGHPPAAGRGACGGARHPARRRIGGARRLLRPQDLGGRCHRRVPGSPEDRGAGGPDHAGIVERRMFLYMPLEHSEDRQDQAESVRLFAPLGGEWLAHAIAHRDVIERFGRFPHRNRILGRESTPAEVEALAAGMAW